MTQEEIIKLAHAAGFNWPDIQATTIEQRLERFAALVAAAEREECANECENIASEVFPHAQAPYKKSAKAIRARSAA